MKNTVNDRVIELKKAICFLESGGEAAILINKKPILITKPGKTLIPHIIKALQNELKDLEASADDFQRLEN